MSPLLQQILREIDQLPPEEQLQVMEHLVSQVKRPLIQSKPKRKVTEFRGMAQCPLVGEDAQEWVARTRREGNERRERLLRGD